MKLFTTDSVKQSVSQILAETHIDSLEAYRQIISLIDLTTLEGNDHELKVKQLCEKAWSVADSSLQIPQVAAVCVYPVFVKTASEALKGKNIHVASVAGAFPSGQSPLNLRLDEVSYAVEQGADEIDMVISRGRFLQGDRYFLSEEVSRHKEACGDAHLKVILETGELNDLDLVYEASMLSMEAGADFIKTSTGKIQPAATTEAAFVMLTAIREYFQKTGKRIGFKPAGGISEPETAIQYVKLVQSIAGNDWLNPSLFRIGASRLLQNLIDHLRSVKY